MTLKELMEKLKETKYDAYVGSKSAYIFMDKPELFLDMVEELNNFWLDRFQITYARSVIALDNLKNHPPKEGATETREVWQDGLKVKKTFTYEELYKEWEMKVYRFSSNLKNCKKQLDEFVPFETREVEKYYYNIDRDALIVIIPGYESGRFWLKTEWERYRNGDKIIVLGEDDEDEPKTSLDEYMEMEA